jgi:hypothetical protein
METKSPSICPSIIRSDSEWQFVAWSYFGKVCPGHGDFAGYFPEECSWCSNSAACGYSFAQSRGYYIVAHRSQISTRRDIRARWFRVARTTSLS